MIASLLSRHFWITAYVCLAAGLKLPGEYTAMRPAVPFLLGGILYFTCLKISLGEVRAAMRPMVLLRVGLLAPFRLLVLPIACWLCARGIAPAWAGGVLLVAGAPTGFSSVAFADLYGGSRMFALLIVLTTCMLCPFTIPLLLNGLGPGGVGGAELAHRILYLLVVMASPFVLAQLTRLVAHDFVERHRSRWNYGSVLSSCLIIFVSVSSNRHAWDSWSSAALVLPLALGCLINAVGFAIGMCSRAVLARGESIAFTCGEIWVNNGITLAFASQFFAGDAHMILPSVLIQVPIVASMALYGWMTRRSAAEAPAPT
jgi:predicted Na+-dependent transporter